MIPALAPLGEQTDLLATITGRQEQASALRTRLDTATEELRSRIAASALDGAEGSVISACGADTFCTYGNARGFGPILTELGLVRPATQRLEGNEWGYETISAEHLDDQAAEVIVAFVGSVSFGAPSPFEHPLLDASASRTGEVDFSAWYGVGPLNHLWVLNDLDAILFGQGHVATAADGPALWSELQGAAG